MGKDAKFMRRGWLRAHAPSPAIAPAPDTLFAEFRAAEAWHRECAEAERPHQEELRRRRMTGKKFRELYAEDED